MTQESPLPTKWQDIHGWFEWRSGQDEASQYFPNGSRFLELGNFLGRSLCSMAEAMLAAGKQFELIGVDTCRGSGIEGPKQKNYHGAAVDEGGGTFAGTLHRNIINCGFGDLVSLIVADSITAAGFFPDRSIDWVHLDGRHDYESVKADIQAWRPKVKPGGWLTGDDYDEVKWPEVVRAVRESAPGAEPWSEVQWRLVVR